MLGLELAPDIPNLTGESSQAQAVRFATLLHSAGLLLIPAGSQVLRLLPPLNLRESEAAQGLGIIEGVCSSLA